MPGLLLKKWPGMWLCCGHEGLRTGLLAFRQSNSRLAFEHCRNHHSQIIGCPIQEILGSLRVYQNGVLIDMQAHVGTGGPTQDILVLQVRMYQHVDVRIHD